MDTEHVMQVEEITYLKTMGSKQMDLDTCTFPAKWKSLSTSFSKLN